jgi:hypothetical protein
MLSHAANTHCVRGIVYVTCVAFVTWFTYNTMPTSHTSHALHGLLTLPTTHQIAIAAVIDVAATTIAVMT